MTSFDKATDTDGYYEKLVWVGRVSKVEKGGRRFKFTALVVVGDRQGRIGYSFKKAGEVPVAIQKAMESARRNMVSVELHGNTIYHPLTSRYGATKVFMQPAAEGTGIIAGGPMRAVFEVLGIENVLAKIIGSANPINVVKATINGLRGVVSPELIAEKRGKTLEEITD